MSTRRGRRTGADRGALLRGLVAAGAFVGCLLLVVLPHRTTSWGNLGLMLLGLAGLLVLLGLYNRRFR